MASNTSRRFIQDCSVVLGSFQGLGNCFCEYTMSLNVEDLFELGENVDIWKCNYVSIF